MELLLNLAWLLLALPAYCLWRDSRRASRRISPALSLLALGCMLVVLFPVISATDDLRVMKAEMEESPSSKRSICQSNTDRPATGKCHPQPALTPSTSIFASTEWGWIHPVESLLLILGSAVITSLGRAPPAASLA